MISSVHSVIITPGRERVEWGVIYRQYNTERERFVFRINNYNNTDLLL
jgi:hypothetical protein